MHTMWLAFTWSRDSSFASHRFHCKGQTGKRNAIRNWSG